MISFKIPLALATAGAMTLGACTDVNTPTNDPNQRTKEGVAVGAISGAIAGGLIGEKSRTRNKNAVLGAIIGGTAGGMIGNNLDKQARELQNNFSNSQIRVVNTGSSLVVVMPQDILFATDSATVNAGLQSDLRVLARSLNDYPNSTVQVIGHTDNTGSASYNQQLSERRANSVVNVLANAGVSYNRLRAIGRGEDQPVASNLTPEGRAQNRRVEIIITPNG
ncbi:MAG: OmpA family protein [Paracoccaceae bacterium]